LEYQLRRPVHRVHLDAARPDVAHRDAVPWVLDPDAERQDVAEIGREVRNRDVAAHQGAAVLHLPPDAFPAAHLALEGGSATAGPDEEAVAGPMAADRHLDEVERFQDVAARPLDAALAGRTAESFPVRRLQGAAEQASSDESAHQPEAELLAAGSLAPRASEQPSELELVQLVGSPRAAKPADEPQFAEALLAEQ
jgi:hypothetical protein